MVLLLDKRGVRKGAVGVQNRFWKARRSAGKINGRVVVVLQFDFRRLAGVVGHKLAVAFGKSRAVFADVNQKAVLVKLFLYLLNAADELRPKKQNVNFGQVGAIQNFVGGIPKIHRNYNRARLQHAKVNRKPFQAVHHQNGNLVAALYSPRQKHVGHAVGLFVKDAPSDFAAVKGLVGRLNQVVVFPSYFSRFFLFRIDFHQSDFVAVKLAVLFQKFCDCH